MAELVSVIEPAGPLAPAGEMPAEQPNALALPQAGTSLLSYAIAGIVCVVSALVIAVIRPVVLHWFLLPLVVGGTLIGGDGIDWLRGKMDTFDPKGLIGAFGIHFFCIGPILWVALDAQMQETVNPGDWRVWIGLMGLLNVAGILLYKAIQKWSQRGVKRFRKAWVAVPGRTSLILLGGIVIALAGNAIALAYLGGFAGFIATAEDPVLGHGLGIPRMIGNTLAILCMIALTVLFRQYSWSRSGRFAVLLALLVLGGIHVGLTGLSMLRGRILTGIVWIVILIHLFWRPLRARTLVLMLVPLLMVLWLYKFYKALGGEVFGLISAGRTVGELRERTGVGIHNVLLGDFTRTENHAYILFKTIEQPESYDLRYGKTYLQAFYPMIPYWIWLTKPDGSGKVWASTELFQGRGWFRPGNKWFRSTAAFGLEGEAMLNFGAWGVLPAFAVFGFLVGRFRRYMRGLDPSDLRWQLVPYGIWFLLNLYLWDFDNYVAHFVTRAGFAFLVVWLMAHRARAGTEGAAAPALAGADAGASPTD